MTSYIHQLTVFLDNRGWDKTKFLGLLHELVCTWLSRKQEWTKYKPIAEDHPIYILMCAYFWRSMWSTCEEWLYRNILIHPNHQISLLLYPPFLAKSKTVNCNDLLTMKFLFSRLLTPQKYDCIIYVRLAAHIACTTLKLTNVYQWKKVAGLVFRFYKYLTFTFRSITEVTLPDIPF